MAHAVYASVVGGGQGSACTVLYGLLGQAAIGVVQVVAALVVDLGMLEIGGGNGVVSRARKDGAAGFVVAAAFDELAVVLDKCY